VESLLHFGQDQIVASLCLIMGVFVLGILLLGILLVNRPIRVRFHHAG
jgi:hypothetical protein